jgi:hypothetical protein
VLWGNYERELIGEQGIYKVWGFKRAVENLNLTGPFASHARREGSKQKHHPAWDTVNALRDQGLFSYVPHLWDNDPISGTGETIHPYGLKGMGEMPEQRIASAAYSAALEMVPDFKRDPAALRGFTLLVPVAKTLPNVQMVGIARLRYRPQTKRTSDWWHDVSSQSARWIAHYKKLAGDESENDEYSEEQTA